MAKIKNFEEWLCENEQPDEFEMIPEKNEDSADVIVNRDIKLDSGKLGKAAHKYLAAPFAVINVHELFEWYIASKYYRGDDYFTIDIPKKLIYNDDEEEFNEKMYMYIGVPIKILHKVTYVSDGYTVEYLYMNKSDLFAFNYFLLNRKHKGDHMPDLKNIVEKKLEDIDWIKKNLPSDEIENLPLKPHIMKKLKPYVTKNKFDL